MQIDPPHRILITRLRFIGDVVLTTPVIRALRRAYPNADIMYLAEDIPASILKNEPDLSEVISLNRTHISTLPLLRQWYEYYFFFKKIRRYRFDLVVDLFSNPRSALLTILSGARYRLGYDVRGRGLAYNIKIKRGLSNRVIDAYLDSARTLELPVQSETTKITIPPDDRAWASTRLSACSDLDNRPIIGINPGASWPAKIWDTEKCGELVNRMVSELGAHVLIIQGPDQEEIVESVKKYLTSEVEIVAEISLTQLAALIQKCRLYISNDCGPMHIAVAVGTYTIGLFGPSDPDIWFPYSKAQGVALKPEVPECCGQDICAEPIPCINKISVDEVFIAAKRFWSVLVDE